MTLTIETPVKTTVVIEPTKTQVQLNNMLDQIKQGFWCRHQIMDSAGRRCALGLIYREIGFKF